MALKWQQQRPNCWVCAPDLCYSVFQVPSGTAKVLIDAGYKCEYRGDVKVKGKAQPVTTYLISAFSTRLERTLSMYCKWINDVKQTGCPAMDEFSTLKLEVVMVPTSLIARFLGPTWGPSGADRTQVGSMLAPWTLLSGLVFTGDTGCGHNAVMTTSADTLE